MNESRKYEQGGRHSRRFAGFEEFALNQTLSLQKEMDSLDTKINGLEEKLKKTPFKAVAKRNLIRAELAQKFSKASKLSRSKNMWVWIREDPFDGDRE